MFDLRSRTRLVGLLLVMAATSCTLQVSAAVAQTSGAWGTFLRGIHYRAILADADTVLCATREGGLVIFDRMPQTFTSITREPGGLASNELTALARDLSGNLWVGTLASGVSRLEPDGQWALVNAFDGLPSEEIRALEPDPMRDSLWIATSAGIALWDGVEIAGSLPDGVNPSPFASDDITGVVVRADSQFISTTLGVYLRRPLPGGGESVDSINVGLPTRVIGSLVSDGVTVMCLTDNRSWSFDFSTSQWIPRDGLGQIWRLHDDGSTIYASSQIGIARWSGATWTVIDAMLVSSTDESLQPAVTSDGLGQVFAATRDGLYELDMGGGAATRFTPDQPVGNNMNNLAVEGQNVYVHTIAEGIARWDGSTWRNWPALPSDCTAGCDTTFRNPAFAFALLVDKDGRKWSSCWGRQMEVWNDHVSPTQFIRPPPDQGLPESHTRAAGAALDSSSGHWFGMDTPSLGEIDPIGLTYYDSIGVFIGNFRPGSAQPSMRGNGKIKALTVDHTGRIWIGHAGAGVQYFTYAGEETLQFRDVSPPDLVDVSGLVATGDTIWASTTNDLRRYNRATGALQVSLPIPAGPSQVAINPLAVATDGAVWLGTTNGVRVYNRDGSVRTDYTIDNSPLASNEVRTIRVDPLTGVMWIATASGLNSFDPFYVPPPPPSLDRLEVRVYPNPSFLTGIGIRLSVEGNTTTYRGWVFDITGRRIRGVAALNGGLIWDGRDDDGRVVEPGIYFIHVEGGGQSGTARAVLLR